MFTFSNSLGKQDSINYTSIDFLCRFHWNMGGIFVSRSVGDILAYRICGFIFFLVHILHFWIQNTKKKHVTFCLICCSWILTTELDCNLHAVNYWAKIESTTALKSGLAVVSALEGVVITVNLFSLMGFYCLLSVLMIILWFFKRFS